MLIDTHCHLHDPQWFTPEQQTQFLKNAHENDVQKIICIGTAPEDSAVAHDFAERHEDVYWTYGIHPEFASRDYSTVFLTREGVANLQEHNYRAGTGQNHGPSGLDFESATAPANGNPRSQESSKLVAIGEIGLDYHYEGYNRDDQIRLFEQMLQLALDLDLPVSLHLRESFADAFAVLDNFPKTQGVIHSFTGSKRDLRQALERGFYIGINGLATYTTPPLPPLENIVLETDAPFLTPEPLRGTINEPGYVKIIASYLAGKLGVAESTIVEQTTQNARKIFQV